MSSADIRSIVADAAMTSGRLREVVSIFYARIREHGELGPLFATIVPEEKWDGHVEKVIAFWLSCFGLERGYSAKGFMPAHLRHACIRLEHIPLWLAVFDGVLKDLCTQKEALAFRAIADAMIDNLRIGLARRDGNPANG